ncbi:MAG: hypothetical protein ACYCQK_01255 [Acidiferrobacteraceae bacterium]
MSEPTAKQLADALIKRFAKMEKQSDRKLEKLFFSGLLGQHRALIHQTDGIRMARQIVTEELEALQRKGISR